MKKFIVAVLVFVIAMALFTSVGKVAASNPVFNTDLMLLSITDVETANQIANGNDELFAETLAQIGYDNYVLGNSLEVDEGYNIFGRTLTADEINLLLDQPWVVFDWLYCANTAIAKTASLYVDSSDGSIANAFQHTYWNVLMVKHLGYNLAEDFATAHENYDGNPWIHKSMDLYNNKKGRDFADGIYGIVLKSADTLANMTQDLVENGELKYILGDYQYISAYIYYDDRVEFEYSTMDLHAYTNSEYAIHMPEYEIIDLRSKPGPIIFPMSIILDDKEVLMDVEEGSTE